MVFYEDGGLGYVVGEVTVGDWRQRAPCGNGVEILIRHGEGPSGTMMASFKGYDTEVGVFEDDDERPDLGAYRSDPRSS